MTALLVPLIVLSGLGLTMAVLLAAGRKIFHVHIDERIQMVTDVLPGVNCGGCSYAGCSGFATAVVAGEANPASCPPGGSDTAMEIGFILGIEVEKVEPKIALVACAGSNDLAPQRSSYFGIKDCKAAHGVNNGPKSCVHGCMGLGSCVTTCSFDAIKITDNGLAIIIAENCTGCGNCVKACPRNIIKIVPANAKVHVLCSSPQKSKEVKLTCKVGCTGCKICTKQSNKFIMDGPLASVDYESTKNIPEQTSLACPQGAIFDSRNYTLTCWINDSIAREDYDQKAKEWKDKEKKRKAELRKAKKAKLKTAEEKAVTREASKNHEEDEL